MEKLPSAFSILYELATLEANLFEKIVLNGEYGKDLTLKQVRQLANKSSSVPSKNSSTTKLPTYVHPAHVAKVLKKINRFWICISTQTKESELNLIIKTFDEFQKKGLLSYEMPEITQYLEDDDDEQLQLAA